MWHQWRPHGILMIMSLLFISRSLKHEGNSVLLWWVCKISFSCPQVNQGRLLARVWIEHGQAASSDSLKPACVRGGTRDSTSYMSDGKWNCLRINWEKRPQCPFTTLEYQSELIAHTVVLEIWSLHRMSQCFCRLESWRGPSSKISQNSPCTSVDWILKCSPRTQEKREEGWERKLLEHTSRWFLCRTIFW